MSVCSTILEMMHNGGRSIQECIVVAEAMERGPDRSEIYRLFDGLLETDCNDEAMAIAVLALAYQINAGNEVRAARLARPAAPHRYRERLGLSPKAWRGIREQIFARDGFECTYCGSSDDPTIDHIVPLIRGGTNDFANLTPACRSCNSSKGDRLLSEWRAMA